MKEIRFCALFALFIFSACRQPKNLVYENVQNFKLQKIGLAQTALSMDVSLYNPNNYSLKLKKADLDVFINDNHLGKMIVKGPYTITKLDTFILPVMLDVDLKNVLPNMLRLVFSRDVDIKLNGTVKAGRRGVYLTIPVNYEGKQDVLSGVR
jgi:LEA14-like dessication related protein